MIARRIKSAKVVKERDAAAVKSKIESIESQFKACHDWANETGQGVLERDGFSTFEEACIKKFPYYFVLLDVFGDRASARPSVTSDAVDDVDVSSFSSANESSRLGVGGTVTAVDDEGLDDSAGKDETSVSVQNRTNLSHLKTGDGGNIIVSNHI